MGIRKRILLIVLSLGIFFASVPLQLVFAGNPPDAGHSSLVATSPGSNTAPADGSTTTSILLTLQDASGVPLVGDSVSLAIPSDATAVISPTSAVLDASGQATFTIKSTTAGTDSIDVTDTTTVTTLTALGQVVFTALPTPTPTFNSNAATTVNTSCLNQQPTHAPDLYQVNTTNTAATLFFVQPADIFDGYTISYGLTQSADSYTSHFQMGPTTGANTYTINSLISKATYYFKIRADNGCAPGPWSPTRKSGYPVSQITKLPETGPASLIAFGIGGVAVFFAGLAFFLL